MSNVKELKLPFVTEVGENISDDLVTTLTVEVQPGQRCADCAKVQATVAKCEGWLLILRATSGDLDRRIVA